MQKIMSKTFSHKIEGKFNNGVIKLSDIPENIRNKWNRKNFDVGRYRKRKNILIEKQFTQ